MSQRGGDAAGRRATPGRLGAVLLGVVLVAAAAAASEPTPAAPPSGAPVAGTDEPSGDDSSIPDPAALEASGAVIGEIVIRAGDIFDLDKPGENRLLYRAANKLHRKTRDRVLRRILLVRPGDRYTVRRIAESERLLRESSYLYDAQIVPLRYQDGVVDLVVTTRDVWTLQAGLNFGRSGGANKVKVGLQDKNLLGWGKNVEIEQTSDVDRTATTVSYFDPNVAGTRMRFGLEYGDNSDGQLRRFGFERPFYSLDARWAVGTGAGSDDREETLYDHGTITDRFRHRRDDFELRGGLSTGVRGGRVRRWSAGYTWRRDRFDLVVDPQATGFVPADRDLAYPWVELSTIVDHYVELHDLDKIKRTEDVNLGSHMRLRLGLSATGFGADRNQGIGEFEFGTGFSPGRRQLGLFRAHASGRFGSGGGENVQAGLEVRYYVRDFGDDILYLGISGDVARRLDPEEQLLLGGDTGLRGYPLRYLTGDRRALLTIEQRIFTDWHPFRLFRVGAAAFFDVGSAWFHDRGTKETLRDVGVGLRLGSSRSSTGSMVHLDLAFPLDGDSSIDSVQFLVTTHTTF